MRAFLKMKSDGLVGGTERFRIAIEKRTRVPRVGKDRVFTHGSTKSVPVCNAKHRGAQYHVIKGASLENFQADFAMKTFRSNSSSGYIADVVSHAYVSQSQKLSIRVVCVNVRVYSSARNFLSTPRRMEKKKF